MMGTNVFDDLASNLTSYKAEVRFTCFLFIFIFFIMFLCTALLRSVYTNRVLLRYRFSVTFSSVFLEHGGRRKSYYAYNEFYL